MRAAFRAASEFVILCEHEKVTFREYFLGENHAREITRRSRKKRYAREITRRSYVYLIFDHFEIHSICKNVVLFQTTQTDDGYRYECDTR